MHLPALSRAGVQQGHHGAHRLVGLRADWGKTDCELCARRPCRDPLVRITGKSDRGIPWCFTSNWGEPCVGEIDKVSGISQRAFVFSCSGRGTRRRAIVRRSSHSPLFAKETCCACSRVFRVVPFASFSDAHLCAVPVWVICDAWVSRLVDNGLPAFRLAVFPHSPVSQDRSF